MSKFLNLMPNPTRIVKLGANRIDTTFFMLVCSLISIRQLVCVWQLFVYDAKSLSYDFYHEKKYCFFCVSNGITATESLKILQKCLVESTLSRTPVFEWHKAFSEGRERKLASFETTIQLC